MDWRDVANSAANTLWGSAQAVMTSEQLAAYNRGMQHYEPLAPARLPRSDLGPKQIDWLKAHIPAFDQLWTANQRAEASKLESNAKALGK